MGGMCICCPYIFLFVGKYVYFTTFNPESLRLPTPSLSF